MIKRYLKKNSVQAVKWYGDNINQIVDFFYGSVSMVKIEPDLQIIVDSVYDSKDGIRVTAKAGDYIMRDNNILIVVPGEMFERDYFEEDTKPEPPRAG